MNFKSILIFSTERSIYAHTGSCSNHFIYLGIVFHVPLHYCCILKEMKSNSKWKWIFEPYSVLIL